MLGKVRYRCKPPKSPKIPKEKKKKHTCRSVRFVMSLRSFWTKHINSSWRRLYTYIRHLHLRYATLPLRYLYYYYYY